MDYSTTLSSFLIGFSSKIDWLMTTNIAINQYRLFFSTNFATLGKRAGTASLAREDKPDRNHDERDGAHEHHELRDENQEIEHQLHCEPFSLLSLSSRMRRFRYDDMLSSRFLANSYKS